MYLEDHLSFEFLFANFSVDITHSQFQHIRCRSLDRHVDRFPFRNPTDSFIGIRKSWNVSSSSKCGFYVSTRSSFFEDRIIIHTNSRIFLIKSIDIVRRFIGRNSERLRKSKSSYPIDHSEIYCFCHSSLFARYMSIFSEEEFRGSHMYIFFILKSRQKGTIFRKPRQHSDFYLRIVRNDKDMIII